MMVQKYDAVSLEERGKGRAQALAQRLGFPPERLVGKRFLEVGCGFGEHCAALREAYRADVVGIDPWPRIDDGPYAGADFFVREDVTNDSVLTLGTFDFIVSYDVLEHVEAPKAALANIAKLLKPKGRAFLKYNLYRGKNASHIVHLTNLPWGQLLHTPDEMESLFGHRPAWVNKLTYAHYRQYLLELDFKIEAEGYVWAPIPEDFLRTHWEKLKAYPRDDLDRDFMLVRLRKTVENDGAASQRLARRVRRAKRRNIAR